METVGMIARDHHGVAVFSIHPAGNEVGIAFICPVKGPCCSGHEGSRLLAELLKLRNEDGPWAERKKAG